MGHHLLGAWADGGLQVMASMAQKVLFHKTWWFEIANTCKYWKWHMNYHEFQDAIANDANVNNGTNRLMFKFNQIHLSMGTYNHPEVDKYHNFNHIPTFLRILLKYPYSIIYSTYSKAQSAKSWLSFGYTKSPEAVPLAAARCHEAIPRAKIDVRRIDRYM